MKFVLCFVACLFSAASFGQDYYSSGPVYKLPGHLNPQPVPDPTYRLPGHLDPRPVYPSPRYCYPDPVYQSIQQQINQMPYRSIQSFPIYSPTYPSQWYRTDVRVPTGPVGQLYELHGNHWHQVPRQLQYIDRQDGRGFKWTYNY